MPTFLQATTLSANQIELLNMVVAYLTRHGVLTPAQLFESPFTDIAPCGRDMIFRQQRFDELVVVLENVRVHARCGHEQLPSADTIGAGRTHRRSEGNR